MRIGEIVASSSTQFVSESLDLRSPPALGSLVKVRTGNGQELFGVVCYGETTSLDAGRRAVRRGTDEVHDEAVYRENPQLEHVLRTEFTSLSVGIIEANKVQQGLPAQPPPLHFSVHACGPEETAQFTESLFYFRLLLGPSSAVPPEHVLASHARQVYRARGDDEAWLKRAAAEVARLLREDYERLLTALSAMEQGRQ